MSHHQERAVKSFAVFLLGLGLTLGLLSLAWCGQMVDAEHVSISEKVLVIDTEMKAIKVRVDNIEGRLFSIFMAVGGTFLTSAAGAVFAGLTHRRVGK